MTGQKTTKAEGGGGEPLVPDEAPGGKSDESGSKEGKRKKMRFSSPVRSSSPGRKVDDVSSFEKGEGEGEEGDEENKKRKMESEEEDKHSSSSGGGSHDEGDDDDDDGGTEYLLFSRQASFSYDLPISLQRGNSFRQHGGPEEGGEERERGRSNEENGEEEKRHSDGQGSPGGGKSSEGSDCTKKGDEGYSSASSIEFMSNPVGIGQALRCTSMESTSSSSLSFSSSYSSSFSSLFSSSSILLNDLREEEDDDAEDQKNFRSLEEKPTLSSEEKEEKPRSSDEVEKTDKSSHISAKGGDADDDSSQEKQDEQEEASESSSVRTPCMGAEREQEGGFETREGDEHERKQGSKRSSHAGGATMSTTSIRRGNDSSKEDLLEWNNRKGEKEENRLSHTRGRFPIVERRAKICEDVYDAIKAVTSVLPRRHSFFACPPHQVPCVSFPPRSSFSSSSFQAIRSTSSASSHQCFMSSSAEMSPLEKEKQRKRLLVERLLASSSSKRPVSRLKSDHEKHSLFRLILSACDGLRIGIIFTGGGGIEGRFVRCTYTRRHVVTPASAPYFVMKKAPSPYSSHAFFSSSRPPPPPQNKPLPSKCGGNEENHQSYASPGSVRSFFSHAKHNDDSSQGTWMKKGRGGDEKGFSRGEDSIHQPPSQQQHRHHYPHQQRRLQDVPERRHRGGGGGGETSSSSSSFQGGGVRATKLGRVNPVSLQCKKKFRGGLPHTPTGNTGGGSGNATGKGGGGLGGRRWCISGIILEDAVMYEKSADLFIFASHINSQVCRHSNRHHHHRHQHHQAYTRGALSSPSPSSSGCSSSSSSLSVGERGPGGAGRSRGFSPKKSEDGRQHPKLHQHSHHHHHHYSSGSSSSAHDKGRDTTQHCHHSSSSSSSQNRTGIFFSEKVMSHDCNRLNVESREKRSSSVSSSSSCSHQQQQQRDTLFIGQYRRENGRSFSLACISPKNITMIFSTSSISDFYNQNIKAGEGIDVRIKRRQGDFIKNKVFDKSRRLGGKKDDLQQG